MCFAWEPFVTACSSHAPVGQTADSHDPNTMIVWWRAGHQNPLVKDISWNSILEGISPLKGTVGDSWYNQVWLESHQTHTCSLSLLRLPWSESCLFAECLFLQGLNEIGDKWVKCNSRSCSILQMGLNQLQPAWPHLFKLVSRRCYSVQISSSHNDPQLHRSCMLCTDQDRQIHVRPLTNPCNNFDKSI